MEILFTILFASIFGGVFYVAFMLRRKGIVGEPTFEMLAKYVRENTDQNTLAAFICSHNKAGNVGLFFSDDRIKCINSDQTVFNIEPENLELVEYSDRNFFKFTINGQPFHLSYLHDVKEAESMRNNFIFASTPNLAWPDPKATEKLLFVLDILKISYNKVPHTKVLFIPYMGSPSAIVLTVVVVLVTAIFMLFSQ